MKKLAKEKFLYVAYADDRLVGYGDFVGCFNNRKALKQYVEFIEKQTKEKITYKIKKVTIEPFK